MRSGENFVAPEVCKIFALVQIGQTIRVNLFLTRIYEPPLLLHVVKKIFLTLGLAELGLGLGLVNCVFNIQYKGPN